jgi:hypothetical protein
MDPLQDYLRWSRRSFLTRATGGLGAVALASLLQDDGLLAAAPDHSIPGPLVPKRPHFTPRARSCIFIYLYGGASHIDLFDPKPRLRELHGQPLPASMAKEFLRVASVRKDTARLLGCPRTFRRHGQCGMEFSDYLPHLGGCVDDIGLIRSMHTDVFNHAPGELMTHTGVQTAGHPSIGAWLTYGLGSAAQNLPGYVVFVMGVRVKPYTWSNGFLPSVYQGVRFRNQGDPVPNLGNPRGLPAALQRQHLDAVRDLNQLRHDHVGDAEIASRIASYELAYRMQSAAPELFDLSGETRHTLEAYGVHRADPDHKVFATNCLLARRLVEREVRFIHLIHSNWDQHEKLDADLRHNCQTVDQPIAALLADLKRRGLLETTLVVVATEFGRTPMSDNSLTSPKAVGRDHHPFAFSIWLAGGGVRGGQVIGKTDELGFGVVEDPVHVNDFHATLLHLFGLDHLQLTYRFKGRDFRLTDVGGKVVDRLLA